VNSPYYRKVYATPPKTASYTQWAAHPAWVTGQEYTSYLLRELGVSASQLKGHIISACYNI
jgi:hypothetical protein